MGGGIILTNDPPNHDRLLCTSMGYKAWTFDPAPIRGQTPGPATGRCEGVSAVFTAGDVISNIHVAVGATGASGITLAKFAIFSNDGQTQYGVTADVASSLTSNGVRQLALASSWTVPATGIYVIAHTLVQGGGTLPVFRAGDSWPGWVAPTAANSRSRISVATGLTDMPSTVTWGAGNYAFWLGAS